MRADENLVATIKRLQTLLSLPENNKEVLRNYDMSAIDFSIKVQKEESPKGDLVNIVMSGKFLPFGSYLARKGWVPPTLQTISYRVRCFNI